MVRFKVSYKVLNKAKILYIITLLTTSLLVITPFNASAAVGDFLAQIDNHRFDTDAELTSIIQINDTKYFANFYTGSNNDGFVETIEVNASGGLISNVEIDKFEFNPTNGIGIGVQHVANSNYYIIGCNDGTNSLVSTLRMFEDGTIQPYLVDNCTMNVTSTYFNISHLNNNHYIATSQDYGANPDPIYLHTIHVNATDGKLRVNDTCVVAVEGRQPRVVALDKDTVVINYIDADGKLNVSTYNVDESTGNLQSRADYQQHNAVGGSGKNTIFKLSDTDYFIGYSSEQGGGQYRFGVGTVTIEADGTITSGADFADSHVFVDDTGGNGYYPYIFSVTPGALFGLCNGNTVYEFNGTGGVISVSDEDGDDIFTAFSNYMPTVIYYTNNIYVTNVEKPGGEGGYAITFAMDTNDQIPEITPYPANNSIIPSDSTYLSAYIADGDGDTMILKWYSDVTGSWKYYGENASCANGTYYLYHADFNSMAWETDHQWRVDVIDHLATHNVTEVYTFRCQNFSGGTGYNASEFVDIQPNLSVNISGAVDNITWYWWDGDQWAQFGNNETNYVAGNYSMHFVNATQCCTPYQWAILTEDSNTGETNWSDYWYVSMCPNPPGSFNAARYNGTAINLTWAEWYNTNATGDVYTYIRYRNDTYPTSPTDGYLAYNGTDETFNHTGLTEGRTYYYSAWTIYHKNNTWCTSSSYTRDAVTLTGGEYNITVRWEGNNSLVSTATTYWDNLRIIFRQRNGTVLYNDTLEDFGSNPFSVDVSDAPDVILLTYEYWGVIRSLTPNATTREVTFWISSRDYWNASVYSLNVSQVYYTFNFIDLTPNSVFLSSPETKFYVYRDYNSTETMTIHQMFLGTDRTAWAVLEYGKEYFIGMECNDEYRERLPGSIFADSTYTKTIYIFPENDTTNFVNQYIDYNATPLSNKIWINLTDSSFQSESITIKIYKYHTNGTAYFQKNWSYENVSQINQEWFDVQGYDKDQQYMIEINITHPEFDDVIEIVFYPFPIAEGIYDPGWFNALMEDVFGESPMGANISYAAIVSFCLGFIFLVTFGQYNGEIGLMSCGFAIFFMEVILWDNSPTRFTAGVVAIIMIVLAILFYMGKRRSY